MTEFTDIEKLSARRKGVPSGLMLAERIRGGATVVALAAEFNSYEWLGYTEDLDGAACFGHPFLSPDAWFPSTQGERRTTGAAATAACNACPVRVTCLTRALDEERDGVRHGIRGGLSEDERAELVEGGAA